MQKRLLTTIEFPRERARRTIRSTVMMDLAVLAIGFVFFALSIAYVYACDLL